MDWKIISMICLVQIGMYVCFRRKNKSKNVNAKDNPKDCNIELIKLTHLSSICNPCLNNIPCVSNSCSFYAQRRIIALLENAQSSIDLCMYLATSKNMADAVVKAFSKGVKVRVITDAENSFGDGSQIKYFREQAIPVRIKRAEKLMHHKFCIVDGNVLITGSNNWTLQSFLGNWEHVLIISEPALLRRFSCEFDELFKHFSQVHRQ